MDFSIAHMKSSYKFESVEEINERLKTSKNKCEIELLKHYLVNYILYLSSEKKEESPIKEKLLKIVILLDKCKSIDKSIVDKIGFNKNTVDKNNGFNKNTVVKKGIDKKETKNPRKKFKENSEKLKERTKTKEDFNIQ